MTPQTPQSLFGLPGWKTAHLDSEGASRLAGTEAPCLTPAHPAGRQRILASVHVPSGHERFYPSGAAVLRKQVQDGQLEAAQAQIELQGHATQRAFFNWMTAEKVAAAQK